ncbi:MAG TPA: zinc ribbon domain-containing protein [Patescibacteria group bacterium]|nr:zinc ribbon domain-containing protein [Patescibacteria group bacterium]
MKCKNCGKNIDEDSQFCPSCGEKVEKNDKSPIADVEKEIIDHLEFLGYEINKLELTAGNPQRYSAIHKGSKPNLLFNTITDIGTSFVTIYNVNEEKIKKNHKDFLETINRMNYQALFCNFSTSPEMNSFVCGAMYLGKYSKKQFADFLDLYESDIQGRLKTEDYLKDFS